MTATLSPRSRRWARSDLAIPEAAGKALANYLMVVIGLEGRRRFRRALRRSRIAVGHSFLHVRGTPDSQIMTKATERMKVEILLDARWSAP